MFKFSVIIPTCHRNDDLALCLERLALGRQTLAAADYEVIVTDDGRTSTAEAMLRERFSWARWVQGPRKGPAANRNFGASHAQGDWLAFTDDDCLPEAVWLAELLITIRSAPDIAVVEGCTKPTGPRLRADMECPVNETGGHLWSCNFAIRRRLFIEIGGFDTAFPGPAMEDMDLHFRLKKAGIITIFNPKALVFHPWRPRKGMAYAKLHSSSVAYFILKHPEQRDRIAVIHLANRFIRQNIREGLHGFIQYHGRGSLRHFLLNLYSFFLLVKLGFEIGLKRTSRHAEI